MSAADESRLKAIRLLEKSQSSYISAEERKALASVAAVWADIYKTDMLREQPVVNDWGV